MPKLFPLEEQAQDSVPAEGAGPGPQNQQEAVEVSEKVHLPFHSSANENSEPQESFLRAVGRSL